MIERWEPMCWNKLTWRPALLVGHIDGNHSEYCGCSTKDESEDIANRHYSRFNKEIF